MRTMVFLDGLFVDFYDGTHYDEVFVLRVIFGCEAIVFIGVEKSIFALIWTGLHAHHTELNSLHSHQ